MKQVFRQAVIVMLVLTGLGLVDRVVGNAEPIGEAGKKEASLDKDNSHQLLQAVGLLATSQVYQAYLNIGFIADGKAQGTYEEKDVKQILETVLSLLDATDKQLEKLSRLDLIAADREGLDRLRKLSLLVRQQGDELQAFWKTGDKEHSAKYEKLRQEAWEGISKLLGLEK